jgi:hypothetical protein
MKRILKFNEYCSHENFQIHKNSDKKKFMEIFESLYYYHLNTNQRMVIESEFGVINEEFLWGKKKDKSENKDNDKESDKEESWFSKLYDKASRGVLKLRTEAEKLIDDLVEKTKDVFKFSQNLVNTITSYIKKFIFSKIKGYAFKDEPFLEHLFEYLDNKKDNVLKRSIKSVFNLLKYLSGKFFIDFGERLVSLISSTLKKKEVVESLDYSNYLINENENAEGPTKKTFLERLIDKIMKNPPFSFIPKIGDLVNKGIDFIMDILDRFFSWVQGKKFGGDVNEKYTGDYPRSDFVSGISFLLDIGKLYTIFITKKYVGKFDDVKKIDAKIEEYKSKPASSIFQALGFSPADLIKKVKDLSKNIPIAGQIVSILDYLIKAIGVYIAAEPIIKKLNIGVGDVSGFFK